VCYENPRNIFPVHPVIFQEWFYEKEKEAWTPLTLTQKTAVDEYGESARTRGDGGEVLHPDAGIGRP